MNWRTMMIIILLSLSIIDLISTYYYVYTYKKWQPNKPYKKIELNPLLRFLWKTFGLHLGMFIGSVVILSLIYIISKTAHPLVLVLFLCVLMWTMTNHWKNWGILVKLIDKYPSGHLPERLFGKIVGNN